MDTQMRPVIHILIIFLGVVLIIGGTALAKPGASIVGLIVAAVNFQQLEKVNNREPSHR